MGQGTPAYIPCPQVGRNVRWLSDKGLAPDSGDESTVKTAQQAQTNYQNSSGRAQADYVAGVTSTQKDQAALAVAAGARYIQGVQDAYANNRWQNGLLRGGTAYWKQQTEKKASNYGTGITNGASNYGVAAQKVMAAIAQGVANLPPRGDINQNLQRSASLATYLHGLKGQLGAR